MRMYGAPRKVTPALRVLEGMGRSLRGCFAGRLIEVTSKTFQSRYLLRPSREVVATLKGVIARAQARTDMKIVAVVGMSNHVHFLLAPTSTLQLMLFMHYFMSNSARKIGAIQGWKGRLWARRYKPHIVSDEEQAQVARLKYLLSHGAKEGLVRSPTEWPGLQVVSELRAGSNHSARRRMARWLCRVPGQAERVRSQEGRLHGEGTFLPAQPAPLLGPDDEPRASGGHSHPRRRSHN